MGPRVNSGAFFFPGAGWLQVRGQVAPMGIGRRILWLGICGMLMQLGLGMTWLATVLVAVSQITAGNPELRKIYLKVQEQQNLSPLSPSSSDAERFFETMGPIFAQLNWPVIALISGLISFGLLGFAYGRITGTTDYLGILPALGLLSGQNPITMAMAFADQGVKLAHFSHPLEAALLLSQLVGLYLGGAIGVWFYRRKQTARPSVTTR